MEIPLPIITSSSMTNHIPPQHSYDIRIKFEPFYVEFHTDEEVLKLPRFFNMQHLKEVSDRAWLCDPLGNLFQVHLEILENEVYFTKGWNEVGNFYSLTLGGRIKLVFLGSDLFLIEVRDRLDREVYYPMPPVKFIVGKGPSRIMPHTYHVDTWHFHNRVKKPDLFHVLETTLSQSDVSTGFLHLPIEFCRVAFRQSGLSILAFDEYGSQTSCTVEFQDEVFNLSGINRGWHRFVVGRSLHAGLRIQIAIPCTNPTLMSIVVLNAPKTVPWIFDSGM